MRSLYPFLIESWHLGGLELFLSSFRDSFYSSYGMAWFDPDR
jgi:hypothetical protein